MIVTSLLQLSDIELRAIVTHEPTLRAEAWAELRERNERVKAWRASAGRWPVSKPGNVVTLR